MKELYALAVFDNEVFIEYVRKGRNNAISGYDNLTGARRGLAQARAEYSPYKGKNVKIVEAIKLAIIE